MALESAKARLENILANLSAACWCSTASSACRFPTMARRRFSGELEAFAASMREQFRAHGALPWQQEVELKGPARRCWCAAPALHQDPEGG
jgi:hypothetical protein